MKSLPIQTNFSAGELSPRFSARSDIAGYQAGLTTCINFAPTMHGPVIRRPGSRHLFTVDGTLGKMFAFPVSAEYGFVVTVTDAPKIYATDVLGGNLGVPTGNNVVANPRFYDLGTSWTTDTYGSGIVSFLAGKCNVRMNAGGIPTSKAYIQQTLTVVASTDYRVAVAADEFDSGKALEVHVGTTLGGTDLVDDHFHTSSTVVEFNTGAATTIYIEIGCSKDSEPTDAVDREIYFVLVNTLTDPYDIDEFTSPWTDAQEIKDIQVAITPEGNTMYFFSRFTPPQYLQFDRATGIITFGAITFTNSPPEWATGNYPGACCFYEGRLLAGGTPNEPNTFWGSRSGVYLDMYIASPSAADDPYSFSMSKYGSINWMAGVKNLIIGMDTGEFIITSEGGIVTPSDIQAQQQSANGSARIQPVEIGNNVIYVSPDGRKIREIGFRWTEDAWVSRDITFTSEHITEDNLIQQIEFAQNPENFLIMTTRAGKALFCVYEWQNNIVGWANAETTGVYHSVASIMVGGRSMCNMLVTREVDTGGGATEELHLELLDCNTHMDDHGEESNTDTILNAQHLAGQEVSVLIDGAVHPNVTIGNDGTASLNWSGDDIKYGLPYLSELKTLPIDKGHPLGSAMSTRKSLNKIYCRIFDSAMPYISGELPPDRSPTTPLNTPEPLMTGDIFVSNLGSDQYAQVIVLMNLPLPCNIGGLFGELEMDVVA